MNYLIDTDILIYSLKGHKVVNDNFRNYLNSPKSVSVVSYGELVFGARKSAQIEKNLAKVRRLGEIFPIINITPAIMDTFGELKARQQKTGLNVDDFDLLIASTALSHNLVLVTNNVKHFSKIEGLDWVNWAESV